METINAVGDPGSGDVHARLRRLEEGMTRQSVMLDRISQDLQKVSENLEALREIQVEQVRARSEINAKFSEVHGIATRAHQRIDKVENNLSRAAWIVITVVIVATLANIGLSK